MTTTLEVLNIEGEAAVSLGRGAAAPGDRSIAIGATVGSPVEGEVTNGAFSEGLYAIALGTSSAASAAQAIAVGYGAAASEESAVAVGDAAEASGAAAVAIGDGAEASAAGAVQLGAGTNSDADTLQFQTERVPTATQYNALLTYLGAGLRAIGTLAISAAAEKFKTTTTAYFTLAGIQYSKAAEDNLVFTAAHIVSANLWGVILVQTVADGTVSTKVPAATQGYASEVLAQAALPDADADNVALGYITINADAGDWTGNTDDMTDASDLTTATFTDATPLAMPAAI